MEGRGEGFTIPNESRATTHEGGIKKDLPSQSLQEYRKEGVVFQNLRCRGVRISKTGSKGRRTIK